MRPEKPYLILAEDDPDDRDFFYQGMCRVYPHVDVLSFEGGGELFGYLSQCDASDLPLCLVLDYNMPPHDAPLILMAMGKGTPFANIPKIVWSTSQRKKDEEECLRLGAIRFVIKQIKDGQLDDFLRSIGCLWGAPVGRASHP